MKLRTLGTSLLLVAIALSGSIASASAVRTREVAAHGRLVIRAAPRADGSVAITVRNTGRTTVALSGLLRVERFERGRWEEVGLDLAIITRCGRSAESAIAPGRALTLVPWSGWNATPQCPGPSPSDFASPAGRYRFVAPAANGRREHAGIPFVRSHLPPQ